MLRWSEVHSSPTMPSEFVGGKYYSSSMFPKGRRLIVIYALACFLLMYYGGGLEPCLTTGDLFLGNRLEEYDPSTDWAKITHNGAVVYVSVDLIRSFKFEIGCTYTFIGEVALSEVCTSVVLFFCVFSCCCFYLFHFPPCKHLVLPYCFFCCLPHTTPSNFPSSTQRPFNKARNQYHVRARIFHNVDDLDLDLQDAAAAKMQEYLAKYEYLVQ